jgi:arginase family enzyme
VYLQLDEALEAGTFGEPVRDLRAWGPDLRCFAPRRAMARFLREIVPALPPFLLYGSGDFHHLAAAFLRNVTKDVTLVSFDNHPDWDRRPPKWACGGWLNRALELPHVRRAVVWGCGNFELKLPSRLFGNRRVEVHGWAERYPKLSGTMSRGDWRAQFESFAASLRGTDVYVTVDLDCVSDAITNWETGLFTRDDVAWAIALLRTRASVVAGDVCGAWSPPEYARVTQRLAAEWDRPKQPMPNLAVARKVNTAVLEPIWGALTR